MTMELVNELKQSEEDHEFYPTTNEIITALARAVKYHFDGQSYNRRDFGSVLDIGAGNGKVLMALKERLEFTQLLAIEKSHILCQELPSEVLVVGTEFREQSLLSKHVDVIFCNPPYSEYEDWAEKIIREAASHVVYLVIPERWESSVRITDAIKFRAGKLRKVGAFDFLNSEDRQARAKVHLLEIALERGDKGDDAFNRFFDEQFADLIKNYEGTKRTKDEDEDEPDEKDPFNQLVVGPAYPAALVEIYRQEMENVQRNYHLVGQLDVSLLKEFDISPSRIRECLKTRMEGMRSKYWHELFNHLNTITDRLTSKSRKSLLETLYKHIAVDFTESNIREVVMWVLKNANIYIEKQLVEVYELMVDKCNVVLYQSNKRVWVEERWRYNGDEEKNSHYALDYRIVTHRIGGIRSGYSFEIGLAESARDFLGDLMTIARNLGFNCQTVHHCLQRTGRDEWKSGVTREFEYRDKTGMKTLFDVRAFLNGNLHLRLNKDFILALNVEHGRLKGWLKSGKHAADELKDPKAEKYFNGNIQLGAGNVPMMLTNGA